MVYYNTLEEAGTYSLSQLSKSLPQLGKSCPIKTLKYFFQAEVSVNLYVT